MDGTDINDDNNNDCNCVDDDVLTMSFSGSSHQKFAKGIAERLGLQVITFINIMIFIVIIKMSTVMSLSFMVDI